MQEATGKFGPTIKKKIDHLTNEYKNIFVTCSKSGKLSKVIYKDFLINYISLYVEKNQFLLLIDSWGGQTDTTIYDEIFEDEKGTASCNIKVIPPKCIPLSTLRCIFLSSSKKFYKTFTKCNSFVKGRKRN